MARSPRRRWTDGRRIDLLDARERWSKFFGVGEGALMEAVDKVGTTAETVRQYLMREHTGDWIVAGREPERRRANARLHISR